MIRYAVHAAAQAFSPVLLYNEVHLLTTPESAEGGAIASKSVPGSAGVPPAYRASTRSLAEQVHPAPGRPLSPGGQAGVPIPLA
jgi:hypothetical protein